MIAHGAQLGKERAAFAGGARLAAGDGEKTAFGFLLGEDDVLLAFFEIVAAVGVVAAGEDVNVRGVGAGEFFVNVEMIAGDGRAACGAAPGFASLVLAAAVAASAEVASGATAATSVTVPRKTTSSD